MPDRRQQAVGDLLHGGDVHGRGKGVVRRLGHVDVVVGMDGDLGSHHPSGHLDGPVGDHLVGVHVALGAAPGLPDAQRELIVELPLGDLAGRGDDQRRLVRRHLAQIGVDLGRRLLQDPDGPDERFGHPIVADRKVVQRPSRLSTPVPVGRDLDRPPCCRTPCGSRWSWSVPFGSDLQDRSTARGDPTVIPLDGSCTFDACSDPAGAQDQERSARPRSHTARALARSSARGPSPTPGTSRMAGSALEIGMTQQSRETLRSDGSLADVLVSVPVGPELHLRVVEVQATQPFEPDRPVHQLHQGVGILDGRRTGSPTPTGAGYRDRPPAARRRPPPR